MKRQDGFTLLEVMAASVITAFIAMVAVSGLVSVTSAREQIDEVTVVNDELRFVADNLRRDLAGAARTRGTRGAVASCRSPCWGPTRST